MATRFLTRMLPAVLLLSSTACVRGFIYQDTTFPLTTNMNETPRGERSVDGSTQRLREPVTGYGIQVEWAGRGVGDVAHAGKLERSYYADARTLSILGGLYRRQTVTVYGAGIREDAASLRK